MDNSGVSNVGDCAGHLNIRPVVAVQMQIGQHLYLYLAHDVQGQLSVPTSTRPTNLRLVHHSPDTVVYTATHTGQSLLTTRSNLCADTRGNTITGCTLLQVSVSGTP